ncbi:MAG: flagellar biosynthesis protein FlhB [Hyphomicrobiaceae bacterium]
MSEQPDKESKTEEASEKKTQDALEKGNAPVSREVAIFGSMAGIFLVMVFILGPATQSLAETLMFVHSNAGDIRLSNRGVVVQLLMSLLGAIGMVILPIVLTIGSLGIALSIAQTPPRVSLDRIKPKMSRLSLSQGWTRVFGASGIVEFLKSLFKLSVVGTIGVAFLFGNYSDMIDVMFKAPAAIPEVALSIATNFTSSVLLAMSMMVVADVTWTRFSWRKNLRMTRQEVKDEMKQSDGDPILKSRLRSLARDRARTRMIDDVPKATMVIANPTHFTVALRYVASEGGAPVVVAKGKNLIALRIREKAEENNIPILEDKPLARALFAATEVGQMIPPEFYKAIANIVFELSRRGPNQSMSKMLPQQ